jgi:hypothetical protein
MEYMQKVSSFFVVVTLAEWLTRRPAKALPSGAQVRILQVTIFFLFFWS